MPNFRDISGQVFTRLTVIKRAPNHKKETMFMCECICGTVKSISRSALISRRTTSCGCYHKEQHTTHRKTKTPEYKAWQSMKQRCHNPKCRKYKNYGGRGITICSEWDDFEVFLSDVGPRTSPKHTLDRMDNNEMYKPGNVRWATYEQQNNNRRNTVKFTIYGVTRSMSAWAKHYGKDLAKVRNKRRNGGDVVAFLLS